LVCLTENYCFLRTQIRTALFFCESRKVRLRGAMGVYDGVRTAEVRVAVCPGPIELGCGSPYDFWLLQISIHTVPLSQVMHQASLCKEMLSALTWYLHPPIHT